VASGNSDTTTILVAAYAAVVATLNVVWTVFQEVFRDRARIKLAVADSELFTPGTSIPARPIIGYSVYNRGRRATYVSSIERISAPKTGGRQKSADIMRQIVQPVRLDEGQSMTITHGADGGYAHGDLPMKRWFVIDGAGRIHPLRERYRQRLEAIIFWPWRYAWRRRNRRS
jgi:hypothetical protein